jgi:hypothetical protein
MLHVLGPHRLTSNSSYTEKVVGAYASALDRFRTFALSPNTAEGTAIMMAANLNYYGYPIDFDMFRGISFKRHRDLVINCLARVNGGWRIDVGAPANQTVGEFEAHYNFFRGLRPCEIDKETESIDDPFIATRFHFGKVTPKEILLENQKLDGMDGVTFDLLFNLFPYVPFHLLIVPNRPKHAAEPGAKQFLCRTQPVDGLKFALEYIRHADDPRLRVAYNSLGAHASINNFHLHGFYLTNDWEPPIEKKIREAMANSRGRVDWWIDNIIFRGNGDELLNQAYDHLDGIHAKAKAAPGQIAYNLYFAAQDCLVLFVRRHQNQYLDYLKRKAHFTTGPAWLEVLGTIIVPEERYLAELKEEDIVGLYRELQLSRRLWSLPSDKHPQGLELLFPNRKTPMEVTPDNLMKYDNEWWEEGRLARNETKAELEVVSLECRIRGADVCIPTAAVVFSVPSGDSDDGVETIRLYWIDDRVKAWVGVATARWLEDDRGNWSESCKGPFRAEGLLATKVLQAYGISEQMLPIDQVAGTAPAVLEQLRLSRPTL